MNMHVRYFIDLILFIIIIFIFGAVTLNVIQKTYSHRKKAKIGEFSIKDKLIVRIISFIVVSIIAFSIAVIAYFINKTGIDITNNAPSLSSIYGSLIISAILKILYAIIGSFLISVSFILYLICCILIGCALDYYIIHPEYKKTTTDENLFNDIIDEEDDKFDNDEY